MDVGKAIGIVVDTVSEVLDVKDENIEPPPSMGEMADTAFILGMGTVGSAVKILLNIDEVLRNETLADLTATAMTGQEND